MIRTQAEIDAILAARTKAKQSDNKAKLEAQKAQNNAWMKLLYFTGNEMVLPNYQPFENAYRYSLAKAVTADTILAGIKQTAISVNMWLGDEAKAFDTAQQFHRRTLIPADCIERLTTELDRMISEIEKDEAKQHQDIVTHTLFVKALGYRHWLNTEAEKTMAKRAAILAQRKAEAKLVADKQTRNEKACKQSEAAREAQAKTMEEAKAKAEAKLAAEVEARRKARMTD